MPAAADTEIAIAPLAAHAHCVPQFAAWFREEWPAWYGPGGAGDAEADLRAFAAGGGLPLGVVALLGGRPCGVAALKAASVPSRPQLGPWAAAGYVRPELRGRGVGGRLLAALEHEARRLGFAHLYCATATAAGLLERAGWTFLETVPLAGEQVAIYRKPLA